MKKSYKHSIVIFLLVALSSLGMAVRVNVARAAGYYVDASLGSDTLYDGTAPTVNGSHGPWATINLLQRPPPQVRRLP